MTEDDWRHEADPTPMLSFLQGASARKLRLFAAACLYRLCRRLPDQRLVQAAEAAERFADDPSQAGALQAAGNPSPPLDTNLLRTLGHYNPLAIVAEPDRAAREVALAGAYTGLGKDCPVWLAERAAQAGLLRDVFGNPFHPRTTDALGPAWKGEPARLARAIYQEKAFEHLAVLADALEEAGCTDEEALSHCRSPGLHVRGCWVVDMLLTS
jgi:hypothetical protein